MQHARGGALAVAVYETHARIALEMSARPGITFHRLGRIQGGVSGLRVCGRGSCDRGGGGGGVGNASVLHQQVHDHVAGSVSKDLSPKQVNSRPYNFSGLSSRRIRRKSPSVSCHARCHTRPYMTDFAEYNQCQTVLRGRA